MIPATTAPEPLLVTRPPSPSFYKRKLPQSCTAYASPQGKQLFKTALLEGNLEGYFPLSSQYITQNEPAYCGLGTLCMILNALDVDPRRKWKGPWRWYEQEMLDCCRPLTAVASVGITLNEFACLARCNGLSATVVSPSPSSPEEQETKAIEKFRSDVKHAAKGLGTVIALSYSRKTLGQTGDGHFSPIGGYCEEQDMVLVLDVARFKYPAYWIPLKLAWESMKPIDKATGQPRGYAVLEVLPESDPSSLSSPLSLTSLVLNKSSWANLSPLLITAILSVPRSPTLSPDPLLKSLIQTIKSLPTPPLAARPSSSTTLPLLLSHLKPLSISATTEGAGEEEDPMTTLFLLALLSDTKKISVTRMIPVELGETIKGRVERVLDASGDGTREEVKVLAGQIAALGECCRAEEENGAASCGCSGVNK